VGVSPTTPRKSPSSFSCRRYHDTSQRLRANRTLTTESEAGRFCEDFDSSDRLGPGYRWPGNVRELEQCVRNLMIRGECRPRGHGAESHDDLGAAVAAGSLTADELIRRYCTIGSAGSGNHVETARRLGLDRPTVKHRVDPALLARLRGTLGR
jgi:transcriptional regulator of acetoin/glycerol metabolism